ncbi:MAG: histidinol-phosphate transaminase [Nitrospinae bacterium CG11_big_fil_rev_8_21_14_0_20_56_8]|nr:MAG: histidinol-phosphate transaminase [Nitrospinae bacterium CG11_big_fil_rev_8_21_14_0_20_56_8]
MSQVNLQNLVRDKVKSLKAYHVDTIDAAIKMHANENPYPPSNELIGQFKEIFGSLELNRYPDPDCRNLKQALSGRIGVPAENLIVGNGSDELILLILQVFCDASETVAFPDPTFAMYSIISRGMGIRPLPLPLDDRWEFKADALLQEASQNRARVLFISYPNNPTGNCFNAGEVRALIENFEGIVVLDEAYHDFAGKTFAGDLDRHNNLVVLRSLSKIGLAGLRVGFGAAHPEIIAELNKVRLPYNSNTVSQTFAEKLMRNFGPVQTQISMIRQERDRLYQALLKMEAVHVFPSDSNFILFRVKRDSSEIFQNLAKHGILIRDLGTHPRLKNCLRVTVGTEMENNRFLEQLANATQG